MIAFSLHRPFMNPRAVRGISGRDELPAYQALPNEASTCTTVRRPKAASPMSVAPSVFFGQEMP
eukprot:1183914-Pyramimonas_sp.AAC.2